MKMDASRRPFAGAAQPAARPGRVRVVNEIRAKVSFARHDLLSLAPLREDFSLVVCQNVLLHFNEAERRRLQMFHRSMRPGGLLVMEHTQKLPDTLAPFSSKSPVARSTRRWNRRLWSIRPRKTSPTATTVGCRVDQQRMTRHRPVFQFVCR